jgi:hypothetical protein
MRLQHAEPSIWSVAECQHLLALLVSGTGTGTGGWQTLRHTAHATTDMPAADLPAVEYQRLVEQIQERLFPKLNAHYGYDPADWVYSFRDLFFVKYEAENGEQTGLAMHADGSLLSFNVLLNPPAQFTGGGQYHVLGHVNCA